MNSGTDESLGSKLRRGKYGRIPDLSVRLDLDDDNKVMLFACEIKTPEHMNTIKPEEHESPDFIKLCNIMKDELDFMNSPEIAPIYGLLVEGNEQNVIHM